MTARRRRKSGSGPSATALIAWVGGARTGISAPTGAPVPVIGSEPIGRLVGSRAIFLGRACGLAAGTLLACGSVLAGATHVGDGSLAGNGAPLPNPTLAAPDVAVDVPAEYPAESPAEPASTAPDLVSAQAVAEPTPSAHPQLGRVRRNTPIAVAMPADEPSQQPSTAQQPWHSPPPATGSAPQSPIAPVSPVLDPAARGVGRVAPVGGVLAPNNPREVRAESPRGQQTARPRGKKGATRPRDERPGLTTLGPVETVKKIVAPVDNTIRPVIDPVVQNVIQPVIQPATQPALVMLTSLLPIG